MDKTKGLRSKKKSIFTIIKDIINTLPTETEKNEIQDNFKKLIDFFNYLQESLSLLPSKEDMAQINQTLQDIVAKAENSPLLGSMLGMRKKRVSRISKTQPKGITEDDISQAKTTIDNLNSLPMEDIVTKLGSDDYSMRDLRAIAIELGIKLTKKYNRETLIEHIASKIVNYRGYRLLSGKSENKW